MAKRTTTTGPETDKNQSKQNYDEFRETLASPIPNSTYRTEIDLIDGKPSLLEQLVRFVAVALTFLLGVRFLINLFTLNRSGDWASFFYVTTNWAVEPFQNVLNVPTVTSSNSFVDWAALAAIAVIAIVAWILIILLHPKSSN